MKTIFPQKAELTDSILQKLFANHLTIHYGKPNRPENVEERKYAFTMLICLNVTTGMVCSVVDLL